jgi:hypothetical protein
MRHAFTAALIAISSSIALAACGGAAGEDADTDGDGVVSTAEAAALLASEGGQMKPEPGKYSAKMTFIKADIPGLPAEMQEMIGAQMANTFEFCLTPEMAEEGFGETMQQGRDDNCTMDRLDIDGGSIDMAMTCNDPGSGQMQIAMTGTISPTGSDLTMVTQGAFGEMGEANIEMNVKQERIGDCDS